MRLIVGLGNPGRKYEETLHNAGFRVCDAFCERHHFEPAARKFQGSFRRGRVRDVDVGVLQPETYMNASGDSVADAIRYLPVGLDEILLVYDDIDLEAGRLRVRPGGGHGGHNGVRSVIDRIGTGDFARLRVGIGRRAGRDATGHVLGKLEADERRRFGETVVAAVDALDEMLESGVEQAMNRYNGPGDAGREEEDDR